MLQVVRVVVHGILIRPSELAIGLYTTHLTNFSIRQINGVLYPCYYGAHTRLAQLTQLRLQFQSVLPLYALLMRKNVPSLAPTFILSRYPIA